MNHVVLVEAQTRADSFGWSKLADYSTKPIVTRAYARGFQVGHQRAGEDFVRWCGMQDWLRLARPALEAK